MRVASAHCASSERLCAVSRVHVSTLGAMNRPFSARVLADHVSACDLRLVKCRHCGANKTCVRKQGVLVCGRTYRVASRFGGLAGHESVCAVKSLRRTESDAAMENGAASTMGAVRDAGAARVRMWAPAGASRRVPSDRLPPETGAGDTD